MSSAAVWLDRRFTCALAAGLVVGPWVATDTPSAIWGYLNFLVLYPLLEELAFRGTIQGWFRRRARLRFSYCSQITGANILTSALFALVHVAVWGDPVRLLVFFPSLVLGFFRDRTGKVAPCIALHAFYNACTLL